MGMCLNNNFFQKSLYCFNSPIEKNTVIINLDKIKEINNNNKYNNNINENNYIKNNIDNCSSNQNINSIENQNSNYIFFKFNSKFKTRNSNLLLTKRNINSIDTSKRYNKVNDNCEKLIHFSNFVINSSSTTYSIPK